MAHCRSISVLSYQDQQLKMIAPSYSMKKLHVERQTTGNSAKVDAFFDEFTNVDMLFCPYQNNDSFLQVNHWMTSQGKARQ